MSAKDEVVDVVAAVQQGYAFDGPALELGALVVDGTARPDAAVRIPLAMVNRHGLVAGATGTGKTKTLQLMAEQLSAAGVPVMAADIKGDLSGLAEPGEATERTTARATEVGQAWSALGCPVELLALGGVGEGIALRATMTSFGPTLLAKVLSLNEVQESSLGLVFHFADKAGLPMLDLKDLRAVVQFLTSDEGKDELKELGGLSRATAGVILRELIAFEDQGADDFFGEPEFDTADLMRVDRRRPRHRVAARAAAAAGPAAAVLDVPDVAAGGPVRGAARGRRRRQAEAGVLLRRGAPALRRRVQGVPRGDRADRAADPVQGRRGLLRDADAEGRAVRRAGPARQPGAARAAGLHPRRREGAQGHRVDLPELLLRPRGDADPARHRRGHRHGALRPGRADAGRLDPAARPAVEDGAGRPGAAHRSRRGLAAARRSTPSRWTATRRTSGWPRGSRSRRPAEAPDGGDAAARRRRRRKAPRAPKPEKSTAEKVLESSAFKQAARSAAAVLGREITRSIFGTRRR